MKKEKWHQMAAEISPQMLEQWRTEFEEEMQRSTKFKPELMVRKGDSYTFDALTAGWDGWRLRAEFELKKKLEKALQS